MKLRRSRTGEAGFTLLELLVVVTIASLLLTVAGPRFVDTVAHVRLKASAEEVATFLRETRSIAMKTSHTETIHVGDSRLTGRSQGKNLKLPYGQTVALETFAATLYDHPETLSFSPNGGSSGGAIIISNGRDQARVTIDWISGHISANE